MSLQITKHQTQNIKLDQNLIYLIANATVAAHNKPQRKTTMYPRTFTLFIWMFIFICCFANFFCSFSTPVEYPRQWASSFATILVNSCICSSYTRMLSLWEANFSSAAISFYFSSSTCDIQRLISKELVQPWFNCMAKSSPQTQNLHLLSSWKLYNRGKSQMTNKKLKQKPKTNIKTKTTQTKSHQKPNLQK